ncbi:MAG: hypothetical protein EAZ76_02900, partial [Nostocales cyanobacterium]
MLSTIFLAQSSGAKTQKSTQKAQADEFPITPVLMFTSGGLLLGIIAMVIYGKILVQRYEKKVKFEKFRTRELEKKL